MTRSRAISTYLLHPENLSTARKPAFLLKGKKDRKSNQKHLWIGKFSFDIFSIEVPVFLTDADRVAELRSLGFNPEPIRERILGAITADYPEDGRGVAYAAILTEESDEATWAHEAVHLADMIMDRVGIDPGIGSTETRAYMVGYAFSCFQGIMDAFFADRDKRSDAQG